MASSLQRRPRSKSARRSQRNPWGDLHYLVSPTAPVLLVPGPFQADDCLQGVTAVAFLAKSVDLDDLLAIVPALRQRVRSVPPIPGDPQARSLESPPLNIKQLGHAVVTVPARTDLVATAPRNQVIRISVEDCSIRRLCHSEPR